MRLIDADELKYKNLAEVNGKLTYVLTAEEIDNAPTVDFEELKPLIDKIVEVLPELTDTIIKELPRMVSREIKCSECSFYKNTWDYIPRPQGEWIETNSYDENIICSFCKTEFNGDIKLVCGGENPKFCPNCGADMRKGGKEE